MNTKMKGEYRKQKEEERLGNILLLIVVAVICLGMVALGLSMFGEINL